MALALLPLILAATAPEAAASAPRVQAIALARAEIVAPVTNDPRAGLQAPLRLVSQTRDGRHFVEFQ